MASFGFKFDDREFSRAVAYVERNTGRVAKETINRAALHVIIGGKGFQGAMQITPKAQATAIKLVPVSKIAAYVMAKNKGKKLTAVERNALIAKEYARRVRAIGYTAFAGWNNAAKAFGGRGLKGVTDGMKKLSRFGKGLPAKTLNNPVAEIINTAPVAEKIGLVPLQMAITNVARDLVAYANAKIQKLYKSVSP